MVSLWDLMVVLSFGSACGGALAAERLAGGGALRISIAALVGLVTGAFCALALVRARRRLRRSADPSEARLRLAYSGAMLWVGVSAVLGLELALSVTRLAVR
jgi:hypothetical protein